MTISALQSKLNSALVTNAAGDYALRTMAEGAQTIGALTLTDDANAGGNYILNDQTTTNMMSKGVVYHWDAVSDAVAITDTADLSFTDCSFEIAFNASSLTSNILFGKENTGQNEYTFNITSSGALVCTFFGALDGSIFVRYTTATGVFVVDTDYHLAITFDSSAESCNIYLNGILVANTKTSSGTFAGMVPGTGQATIGNRQKDNNLYHEGGISKVVAYNLELSAAEVKDLISGNIPFKWQYGSQTGLITAAFSGGVDDWTQNVGDVALLLSAPETIATVGDALKCLANGKDIAFGLKQSVLTQTVGKEYLVTFDYYADASCGVAYLGWGNNGNNDVIGSNLAVTEGAWQTGQSLSIISATTSRTICGYTTETGSTQDVLLDGTSIYFKNIVVTPIGAVALYDQTSISETYWGDVANNNDGAVTGATVLNQPDGMAFKNIILSPVGQDATPKEGQLIYNSATNKLNVWTGAAWEVVTSA